MRVLLDVKGMSQHHEEVHEKLRNSACGPVTTQVILNYICDDPSADKIDINALYKFLGSTKIGLFKWRMVKNLRKLLGKHWLIATCDIDEALVQLQLGRPVALRFDIYFNWQFLKKKKPLFKYHWVPLIGYEMCDNELYLMVHDNGGRNRESRIRTFKYEEQKQFLSFVKIEPSTTK